MGTFLTFYLVPRGRLDRRRYWLRGVIPLFLIGFLHGTLVKLFGTPNLSTLLNLLVLWPTLAISARRLHDVGVSGWWASLYFLPLGFLVLTGLWHLAPVAKYLLTATGAALGLVPGSVGPNMFGPYPSMHGTSTEAT